jgi:NAD(P)-dependent dehydrogenase (short-subunit alcohol dehydrogenase family)
MTMRVNAKMFSFIPSFVIDSVMGLAPVRRIQKQVLADLGIPKDMFTFINYPTRFDTREAEKALKGSGISVPRLEDYAWRLWDYWERHLDPDLFIDRSLAGKVQGKVAVVTGGTSGIGEATAYKLAEAGAQVIVVARDPEKAVPVMARLKEMGGKAKFISCDLSSLADCDKLVAQVAKEFGRCDFLVNNAGRSIRRGIASSYDRFHDFERTMQLNYFGSLRLIMGFMPTMVAQGGGHIINISSIGVLTRAPRFSAYVASKAALDAFSDCAASEFIDNNVHFTTINMPLVKTPMIAPTKLYNNMPTLSPEQAADLVVEAIIHRPVRIATRLGIFGEVLHAVAPKATQIILNTAFRMFPDSSAAQGRKKDGEAKEVELTPEQVAFAQITQGIHW